MGVLVTLRNRLAALLRPDGPTIVVGEGPSAAPPDPARPPARRGSWEQAALANVDVTEVVKRQIRTVTRPWNK